MIKRNGNHKIQFDGIQAANLAIKLVGVCLALFMAYLGFTAKLEAGHKDIKASQSTATTKLEATMIRETGALEVKIVTMQTMLNENIQLDASDHSTFKTKISRNETDIHEIERRMGP